VSAPDRIRPARQEDVPRVWEMLNALARYERLQEIVSGSREALGVHLFGAKPLVECLVCEERGALIGYALFYPTYSSFRTRPLMWLEDLFIEPEHRGSGAGRALLEGVARRALERGCSRLDWNVLDWNEPSIRFYEALGAKRANTDWYQYGLEEGALRTLIDTSRIT
jgi:GNAT superfamily N-acetyltransferase